MFSKDEIWQILSVCTIIAYVTPSHAVPQKCAKSKVIHANVEKFENRLYSELVKAHPDSNVIYSPCSISMCIAMVGVGAVGDTASEITKALTSIDLKPKILSIYYRNIMYRYQYSPILTIANRMLISDNAKVKKSFNNTLVDNFFSSAQTINVIDGESAARDINSWVEIKTNHLIKDLVKPDFVSADTKLVLVNVMYFKGQWEHKFDVKETQEADFFADKKFKVQMMHTKATFNHAYIPELQLYLLEMPYRNSNLSMLIILPSTQNTLNKAEETLKETRNSLFELHKRMEKLKLDVYIPKFNAEFQEEMSIPLRKMGLENMFSANAKLDNILENNDGLFVSKLVHKAVIKVDEEGAEAAAASAVEIDNRFADANSFRADRPFIYIIWDQTTVFFKGRFISDPKTENSC